MMRVRFLADYDYKPTRGCTIGYKAGMVETVKRACGLAVIAAGKAIEMAAPHRNSASPEEVPDNGD
jgi:hypothetical protein